MIVAPQPEPVEVGAEVLRSGGNAVDATIAAALVQGVVDPLMCGLGGFALMQIHQPGAEPVVIDGLGRVPEAASEDLWVDRVLGETSDGFGFIVTDFVNEAGATSALVPGTLWTLDAAHARYGRLPWADLVAPAIEIARAGWLIRPHVYTVFTQDERRYGRMNYGEKLGLTPDGRRIYLRPDGTPKGLGELVVNPELAQSLAVVATEGADALATGSLGGVVADSVARAGGLLTAADLSGYAGVIGPPLTSQYRGWGVSVPPDPGGGTFLVQTLGLLERLLSPGQTGHNSAAHLMLLAEVMKAALRDKEATGGDPDFSDRADADILDPEYLDDLAAQIRTGRRIEIGRLPMLDSRHTTHVSAVDADGLTVALTHTLGNPSGFIPTGTGFMLNGGMSAFDPRPGRANSIAAGKRRLSTMCPTLIFAGQSQESPNWRVRASATLGAPGASWIGPALLQVISNLLDWGMHITEAVGAPRIAATGPAIDISNRIARRVEAQLRVDGYQVRRSPLSYAFGAVHAITAFDGQLHGAADPQRDGYAAGV